jgi:hypothetical protein
VVITVIFGFLWARDVMAPGRAADEPGPAPEPAPEDEAAAETYPRNVFLELTTLGLGGVITAIVAIPVTAFAIVPAYTRDDPEGVDLGPLENFPEGEWREVTFLLDPAAGEVSRSIRPLQRRHRRRPEHDDHLQPLRPPRLSRSVRRPP